jgi:hypothetical protein
VTEAEWLACDDLVPMLKYLFGPATIRNEHGDEWNVYLEKRTSDRKLRLFAVACCFRIWQLISDERCRRAVVVGEQDADGEAETWELEYTREEIEFVRHREVNVYNRQALQAACWAIEPDSTDAVLHAPALAEAAARSNWYTFTEQAAQVALLRDIFGNPFRPVAFSPVWRTSTAVTLAQQMYDAREFSAMPILADALQDAGCDNEEVLNHCRGADGTHVRGCWVVDLVLGKG